MTGTTVVSERPSRDDEPELGARRALVEDLDDPVGGAGGRRDPRRARASRSVTVGTSLRATTSAPGAESRQTTARRARSGTEQRQLRLEVLAHVGVVVEVVVGQVGEPGDVEHDAVDAATAERLGAHLDGDGLDAALAHESEQRVHLVGLGGRQARHDHLARDVALGGGREAGRRRRAGRGCPRAGATTLVLPLVPVGANRIGRWSSRPVP